MPPKNLSPVKQEKNIVSFQRDKMTWTIYQSGVSIKGEEILASMLPLFHGYGSTTEPVIRKMYASALKKNQTRDKLTKIFQHISSPHHHNMIIFHHCVNFGHRPTILSIFYLDFKQSTHSGNTPVLNSEEYIKS